MELTALLTLAILLSQGLSSPVAPPGDRHVRLQSGSTSQDVPESSGTFLHANPEHQDTRHLSGRDNLRPPYPEEQGAYAKVPTEGCTTTISEPGVNPCSQLNGVQTVYPSTSTSYKLVDCHGCPHVSVAKQIYYCPLEVAGSTETADAPFTTWSTLCAPTAASPRSNEAEIPTSAPTATSTPAAPRPAVASAPTPKAVPARDQIPSRPSSAPRRRQEVEPCPTTFVIQPDRSAGSTFTEYLQWVTTTAKLDCQGCPLTVSTALAGYGPAGRFKDTVTVPIGTTTVYTCSSNEGSTTTEAT